MHSYSADTLTIYSIIDSVVSCVPSGWTVDLDDAEIFFLIGVFKVRSLCCTRKRALLIDCHGAAQGLWHWYRQGCNVYQKLNAVEIANSKNVEVKLRGEGHITTHEHAPDSDKT
jgi:hypothetical protein